jgi:hypothetical protein
MKLSKLREGVAQHVLQKINFMTQDLEDDTCASAISYGQIASSHFGSNLKSEEHSSIQSHKEDIVVQITQTHCHRDTMQHPQITLCDRRIGYQSPEKRTSFLMLAKSS